MNLVNEYCKCGSQIAWQLVMKDDISVRWVEFCNRCARNHPIFGHTYGNVYWEQKYGPVPISHQPEAIGVLKSGSKS